MKGNSLLPVHPSLTTRVPLLSPLPLCAPCSLEELQFALQELGVQEAQAQSRAAAELLQLAAADAAGGAPGGAAGGGEGEEEEDGTIGFETFMAFQRKVGGGSGEG